MYISVSFLSLVVMLSLGYVVPKAGVEEKNKVFSLKFDVISPWDNRCKYQRNSTKCEIELSGVVEDVQVENLEDGMRYVMPIEIGANKQAFRVLLDTGSDVLWVFGDNCVDEDNKFCKGHAKYVLKKEGKYEEFKIGYAQGEVTGKEATDIVCISDKIVIPDQLIGVAGYVDEEYEGYDGTMGLNMDLSHKQPSVIYNMIKLKLITEPIYSMYLKGGKSAKDGGEITFGGHNEKLIKPNSGVIAKMLPGGEAATEMTSLTLNKEVFCGKDKPKCKVRIDSGCSNMHGTKEFIDKLHSIIGADDNNQVDCKKREQFPTIEIMIGNGKMTLEPKIYAVDFDGDCFSSFTENHDEEYDWSFGLPFFVKYYTEFNFSDKHESITFWETI